MTESNSLRCGKSCVRPVLVAHGARSRLSLCTALAGGLVLFGAGAAQAQASAAAAPAAQQPSNVIGDIVVTAQRREEKLQNVGVSVVAASADQLRASNVMDSKDIAKLVPGVVLDSSNGGSFNANLTVRGVSQSDFSPFQESPNSIYFDEIYLASPSEAAFNFYDLARIEVLRGPQGTLFGKASSGGLASFISKRPTDTLDGYMEAGVGSYSQFWAEGAIGGPLSDRIRARISGRAERSDGWFKNEAPDGKDTFETRFFGIRGQVEADLSDRLTARVQVSYDDNPRHREGTYKPENYYVDAAGNPAPLPANVDAYGTGPGNDVNGYRDPYKDGQTGSFNNIGFEKKKRFAPSLYLTWKGGAVTITSITNYTDFKNAYGEDSDGTPINFYAYVEGDHLKQFSQELRANGTAGNLTYTAGAYYLNINDRLSTRGSEPIFSGTPTAFDVTNLVHQKTTSIGFFGQLEYKFSDALTGTLGGRWTHENKTFSSIDVFNEWGSAFGPVPVYDFSPATVGDLARDRTNMWSGKAQLNYKPSREVLLYASVSRGSKGPGFNSNSGGAIDAAQTPYKGEHIWAYEVGAKNTLFGGRTVLNLSAFYYNYANFQGFAYQNQSAIVGNYKSDFYGGEVQLITKLPADITVNVGAAYLKSKIRDVQSAYYGIRDEQGVMAPRWTVNGSVSKDIQLGENKLNLNWSFDYIGDRYASIDNNAATLIPGSFIHNIRVSYRLPASKLEIAGFVNNISDKDRENFVFDTIAFAGTVLKSYARPRWFGLSVRKDF